MTDPTLPRTSTNPTLPRTVTLRKGQIGFAVIVVAFLIYAALFIYRTSFVVHGERYFSLFDDAMISMRYARNLAHGYGLVWNPGGERVEGYTNPLWVLFMAVLHLFPVPQSKISLLIQLTAAGLLAVNLYFVRKVALAVSDGSEEVAAGAVVLTASYLPINNWSLQGMEVAGLVLIMTVGLWLAFDCVRNRTLSLTLYMLLGASTLVRPDMVVPFAGLVLFLAAVDPDNRRRHIIWGSAILMTFYAAQTAFRFWYFGDILPNTYYLKLTGYPLALRLARGIYVLAQFVWKANVLLFIVALAVVLARRRDSKVTVVFWVLVVQIAYSVYVGGDAWEYWGGSNRYISIAMPGFFILLAYGLFRLAEHAVRALGQQPVGMAGVEWMTSSMFALLIAYSVLSVNSIYGPGALAELLLIHSGNGDENSTETEQALFLRTITTADATMAVTRAGTIPYFSERPGIDLLGKTDRFIAHEDARRSAGWRRFVEFRPGHMKFDYDHSVGRERPDVIVQLWGHLEEVQPYLDKYYKRVREQGKCLYVRDGSPNVLWDKLSGDTCR
jgi:hypothetical protein